MSYSVRIRYAAEQDVIAAQRWYEQQQLGLAARFHEEFAATIKVLADTPLIYPELYRHVRRALVHRFPYLIWYRADDSIVTILACTHGRIAPSKVAKSVR